MVEHGADCDIAVDAMGGDLGTAEVIRAVDLALQQIKDLRSLVLVGKERLLRRLLEVAGLSEEPRIRIFPASEVIGMDEKPIESIKKHKDASMMRALELVKEGHCKAVVSCGNTGSLVAGATLKLRPLPGVARPALATTMPAKKSHFVIIDAGANSLTKPEHLVHNAILGSHYARVVLEKADPTIGLLCNGTEVGKGNELTKSGHQLLEKVSSVINYRGLVEYPFNAAFDVVVTDGFTGNVVLKSCESLVLSMREFLKEEIQKNPMRLTGALLSQGAYKNVKDQLNRDRYGGAPLLGLRGHVLKAHGGSNRYAIMNAIRMAQAIINYDINARAAEELAKVGEILAAHREE